MVTKWLKSLIKEPEEYQDRAEYSLVPYHQEPIIIDAPNEYNDYQTLSGFLRIGRQYHKLCRNNFVELVQIGYYTYEKRNEWRTCALAAAYAGAFGSNSIEHPDFSHSMAIWQLNKILGYDINRIQVIGPTGRRSLLSDEMIYLVDNNLWTRAGVADWLEDLGF